MCFSVEADVVAGLVVLPMAVVSLREVRHVREVPFASLPLLFALHQLTEALVWAHYEDGWASPQFGETAVWLYVGFAMVVLPTLFPLSVLLLEPQGARLRVAPFVVLGAVLSVVFAVEIFTAPVTVVVHPHALEYATGLTRGDLLSVLYVVAVIGPALFSGYRSIVAFGLVNLAGLLVVAVAYLDAFASLWCVYAALTSALVVVHMIRRRRLPDADRLEGLPEARHSSVMPD
ncbi:conserved membrane hypothetical protein [metagenome]|uniref:Uncharacterized protein n=1 Tax=metagenome TaxID=256318 RepID=A0A2P2BXU9_9ZZZZ